jgi:hypothetical protein
MYRGIRYWLEPLLAGLVVLAVMFMVMALLGAVSAAGCNSPKARSPKEVEVEEPAAPAVVRTIDVVASKTATAQAAIQTLQPWYAREANTHRGRQIASIIARAAHANGIDVLLAVALAMRESSLRAGVGLRGSLGEQGMFQVMPRGYARRVCPRRCSLDQPGCNADVALCYLSHVRELCASDDAWVWIGAYGTNHCPTPREARAMPTTMRARRFLVAVAGEERAETIWPE